MQWESGGIERDGGPNARRGVGGRRVSAVSVRNLAKSYGDTRRPCATFRSMSRRGKCSLCSVRTGRERRRPSRFSRASGSRSGGHVETLGVDPAQRDTQRWLRSRIGVVLQELAVEPFYTVRQVLSRNAGYYPSPRPIDEVIELIGLKEKADERVKKLSGGQQRRLDVGLGIVGRPELLFLDEPTTGLDPSGRRDSWNTIRALTADGTTVMLTTHYMDEVEALADQVAVLNDAEIVACGTPTSIGGRDSGMVTIRFALPEGVATSDLPLDVHSVDDGLVEICTEDELRVLHALTGWAIEEDLDPPRPLGLPGLARGHLPQLDEGGTHDSRCPDSGCPDSGCPDSRCPAATTKSFQGLSDVKLIFRQMRYEQLSFWLNPIGAIFTVGFSTIFLVLLGSTAGQLENRARAPQHQRWCSTTCRDSWPTGSCRPASTSWPSRW